VDISNGSIIGFARDEAADNEREEFGRGNSVIELGFDKIEF
jgi:hypothetical protein